MRDDATQELLVRMEEWAEQQSELPALYPFGSQVTGKTLFWGDLDVAALARFDVPRRQLWRREDRWAGIWDGQEKLRADLMLLNPAPLPFCFN